MATLKTRALVLRNRRFSESSLVVTLLSREHGRLDVLAKGCRRDKSPLFGHLDLYQMEDVLVIQRPQAGLDLLTEAAFVNEHAGLRLFAPAFAAAGALSDLAAEAILPGEPQTGLFDTLAGALKLLSDLGDAPGRAGLAPPLPFTAAEKNILAGRTMKLALLDMLGWLGFGLELRRCLVCGREDADERAFLSRAHGGLVCSGCRGRSADAVAITQASLEALRNRGEGSERLELGLSVGERRRWLRFLLEYAQHALEKPLRGRKVLLQLLAGAKGR